MGKFLESGAGEDKAGEELSALACISSFMKPIQIKLKNKTISLQFSYCPLVWFSAGDA